MTRILNTRPAPNGRELSEQLTEQGFESVIYPVIVNQAITCSADQLANWLADPDCAWIFISKPSVLFFNQYLADSDVQTFSPKGQVFAVGNSTAKSLQQTHVKLPVFVPNEANSESLIAMSELTMAKKVVLVKGVGGRGLIQSELQDKGIDVIELDLYQRVPQNFSEQELQDWFECNIVLATSVDIAKAILNNCKIAKNESKKHEFLQNSSWLVLSERIKEFLIQQGITQSQIHVCDASDNFSIIKLIKQLAKQDV